MQVAEVQAELEKERQERDKATAAMTQQHEADMRAARQRETALEERIVLMKREGAGAAGEDGNEMDVDGADANGEASGGRPGRRSSIRRKHTELQTEVRHTATALYLKRRGAECYSWCEAHGFAAGAFRPLSMEPLTGPLPVAPCRPEQALRCAERASAAGEGAGGEV